MMQQKKLLDNRDCSTFTDCASGKTNNQLDHVKDSDIMMLMYNMEVYGNITEINQLLQ